MKSSRMKKVHMEFKEELERIGLVINSEEIQRKDYINGIDYTIAIRHVPRTRDTGKEKNAVISKISSKLFELNKLVDECIHNYPSLSVQTIVHEMQKIDSYNKKIKKISKELIYNLERQSIEAELSDFENVRDYPDVFPLARRRKRKIIAHLGETNSGKTFTALSELASHTNTAYLAPLRLLALENYDYLNSQGIPTSLITGEERRIEEDAVCTSSTVECFNFNKHYDLIILDEIQMVDDIDRGWAFIQALVGANADTIIVTGPKEYEARIKQIADYLGDDLEVRKFDRKSKLVVDKYPTDIRSVKKNTAIVVFSRRDIYRIKKELPKNLKASLIYGALGSDVRKLQAQRYISGETDVLITTDAVGMGLNLPIEHIVFTTHQKYNGITNTVLGDMLTKQIAGRAGRFGMFDIGYVGAQNRDTLEYVKQSMKSGLDVENKKFSVQPTDDYITSLLSKYQLSTILSDWSENTRFPEDSMFVHGDMSAKIMIAKFLESNYMDKVRDYYRMINCPVDIHKDFSVFKMFAKELLEEHTLTTPKCIPERLAIADLEFKVKEMLIFMWFLNQFPENIPDYSTEMKIAVNMLNDINRVLNKKLSK